MTWNAPAYVYNSIEFVIINHREWKIPVNKQKSEGFHQSLYLHIYIYLHSGSTCSKSMSNKSKLLLIRPHNKSFIFLFLKVKRFFLFFVCESLHFFHFDDNFEIVWYTTISVSVTKKKWHLNFKKMSRTNCFLNKKFISDSLSVLFRCSIFKNILSLISLYSQPAHSAFLIFHQGVVLKFLNGPYASLSLCYMLMLRLKYIHVLTLHYIASVCVNTCAVCVTFSHC